MANETEKKQDASSFVQKAMMNLAHDDMATISFYVDACKQNFLKMSRTGVNIHYIRHDTEYNTGLASSPAKSLCTERPSK